MTGLAYVTEGIKYEDSMTGLAYVTEGLCFLVVALRVEALLHLSIQPPPITYYRGCCLLIPNHPCILEKRKKMAKICIMKKIKSSVVKKS